MVGCLILIAAAFVGVEIFFRMRLEALLGPSLHPLVVFLYHLLTATQFLRPCAADVRGPF